MTDDETTKKTGRSVKFPDRLGASTTRGGMDRGERHNLHNIMFSKKVCELSSQYCDNVSKR